MKSYNGILIDDYFDKIYFSFSDRYIQEYYHYDLDDLIYFLKLSLLYGRDIYITGANVWQSSITYLLYKEAFNLFDNDFVQGMVHLSTRKIVNEHHIFDDYFVERSEENEHFLTLPGIYALLDSQIYDRRNIAKQLDDTVLPVARSGASVSELLAKNIINLFNIKNIYINEEMSSYLNGKLLSRSAIANYILSLPYHYNDMVRLIEQSNFAYHLANAQSNKAALLYPRNKNDIILYSGGTIVDFLKVCQAAGLTRKMISQLSFDAIACAKNAGILSILHRTFRFVANEKEHGKMRWLLIKTIYTIVDFICHIKRNCSIGRKIEFFQNNSEIDIGHSFIFNLNRSIIGGEVMQAKDIEISSATMIEEINKRFSLEEIKNISTAIFDGYDQFPHSSRTELSRELCLACKRTDKMSILLSECLKRNSNFNILPKNMMNPLILTDWRGEGGESGDYISGSEYEQIIESRSRFQSISFLEKGLEVKDRICMIKVLQKENRICATGFLMKNRYIMTNRHVFLNKDIVKNAEAIFGYDECKDSVIQTLDFADTDVFISQYYDLAIARLKKDIGDYAKVVDVRLGDPQKCMNDIIPIIQHPNGMPKQICIGHNSLKYVDEERIQYLTDTLPGSSGSPVFNSNWELIGLHSKGGNICEPRTGKVFFRNEGINIRTIEKFIKDETPLEIGDLL